MIWKPHVTVATIVERAGKFLFVEEEIDGQYVINQPAGHLEDGETLIEAAVRETLEETAWRVSIGGLVGIYRWQVPSSGKTFIRVCFHGNIIEHHDDRALDVGIVRVLWMSASELQGLKEQVRSPLVLKCLSDHINGCSYPADILKEI